MKLNYFNFKPFESKILMTNDFGKYTFVDPYEFKNIIAKKIVPDSLLYKQLIESKMIYDVPDIEFSQENKFELRNSKGHVSLATSLHIFVVTTACNMGCVYCQANNGKDKPHLFMNKEIAKKAVDIALQSPEISLSFEFQGGEPLLNFEIIKYIVEYAEENKGIHHIEYNVVTNLTLLTDEIISFLSENHFGVSTSLDGFKSLHDQNRPFQSGEGTYNVLIKAIDKARQAGIHVGAIETTTKTSLDYPREIVRAYKDLGFDSIFIRPLTPLGKANISWNDIGYNAEEFINFYNCAFNEILKINADGYYMKEAHASIFMNKINGNLVNYMELRSPCGAGVGQLAYYADGNIFTCDEARMMFEMGLKTFYLGNVFNNNYNQIIKNSVCKTVCASSILESLPSCCDCVYQPYCGTCPVVNYALNEDIMEKNPREYRCKIYSGMLDLLFSKLLENDEKIINILNSWSN